MHYCDGASRGNPGDAGYGFICRDSGGGVLVASAGGLGVATNFQEEIFAIINACHWALSKGFLHVCIRSNSVLAIKSFTYGKVPWYALNR